MGGGCEQAGRWRSTPRRLERRRRGRRKGALAAFDNRDGCVEAKGRGEGASWGAAGLVRAGQWMMDAAAGEDDCAAHDVSQKKGERLMGEATPIRRMKAPQSGHCRATQVWAAGGSSQAGGSGSVV